VPPGTNPKKKKEKGGKKDDDRDMKRGGGVKANPLFSLFIWKGGKGGGDY